MASSSPKLVEEVNVEDVVQLRRDHAVSEGVYKDDGEEKEGDDDGFGLEKK